MVQPPESRPGAIPPRPDPDADRLPIPDLGRPPGEGQRPPYRVAYEDSSKKPRPSVSDRGSGVRSRGEPRPRGGHARTGDDFDGAVPGVRAGRAPAVPGRMSDVDEVIVRAHREEWARVVAALARRFGDLDIAEEMAAEAFATAVERWPVDGVPPNPGAWLTTTAYRKAIDRVRREARRGEKHREA